MNRAMRTAATGMVAQQFYVDTIAHNLANVNTTGYKKTKIEFQDLFYQVMSARSAGTTEQAGLSSVVEVGHGARVAGTQKIFTQGNVQPTSNPLDLAISGDGFFRVTRSDGSSLYSRDGSFRISEDGRLVTADGYPLEPEILIPEDAREVRIARNGLVEVVFPGEELAEEVGQIELVKFLNPTGLAAVGGNLYEQTGASGEPILGVAGEEGLGTVNQGFLEASNVDVVEEMINMIMAQRAYEISSKAIRTSEEMLAMVNNLKR
jgi:flagellar basal-body rod protein FlgG